MCILTFDFLFNFGDIKFMSFIFRLVLFSILFISSSAFSKVHEKTKPTRQLKIINFFAVKKLSLKAKSDYLRAIAKTLIKLNKEPKEKYSKNILNLLFCEFKVAHASTKYLCIGGGVPVPKDSNVCGVNSYAGFTCPEGLEICNPLIFGVDKDKKPVCHITATTSWCFLYTKLGVDQFLDPVFAINNAKQWNELLTYLEDACNNPESIAEDQKLVSSACDYSLQQMIQNEEVKKILSEGYTYQSADGYNIKPKYNPENEELADEVINTLENTREDEIETETLPDPSEGTL